jgi:hypothetical protein
MQPDQVLGLELCARRVRQHLPAETHTRAGRRTPPEWPRNRGPTPGPRRR